jgi:hypothetical protein
MLKKKWSVHATTRNSGLMWQRDVEWLAGEKGYWKAMTVRGLNKNSLLRSI